MNDTLGTRERFKKPGLRTFCLAMLLVSACQITACGWPRSHDVRYKPSSITVAVASDLTDVLNELSQQFNERRQGSVVLSFGSTGSLTTQIEEGAPFDVFMAANRAYVENLEHRRLVLSGTQQVFARGRLTLWQRAETSCLVNQLNDLRQPCIRRISIANPEHAPYGMAARQALERTRLWPVIREKLVFAENISQCRQFAETGNVDVAILALSISHRPGGRYVLIDSALHEPILQTLCILKRTSNETLCREWIAYLFSPSGRSVMERYGFIL
jgi:molybdate transport system substrate-binding protein